MEKANKTLVTEFLLVGFDGGPGLRVSVFTAVLLIFAVALSGNVTMMVMICINLRLHSPMYFFLWNLSLIETLNILNIAPLILVQTFSLHFSVSKSACFMQSFLFYYLGTNVFFLLPIMSYDRYVAICNPLRYTTIMTSMLCMKLVIASWIGSFILMLCPLILTTKIIFCGANIIDHFFCDGLSILKLACTDTWLLQVYNVTVSLFLLPSSLGYMVVSYTIVISSVLRIPSTSGRRKAFSTCSSHLTMVAIVYGCAIAVEVSPMLKPSARAYKTVSVVTPLISPLMNPFVYTFSNERVKEVLKKRMETC
ncbi:olfactory receptor 6X1-like [Ambystoma mexicanum]|uniref:olfactory receptor 6X1-like n=1 Tax=Ambystoma mexicanum TaxID=8296 RepID=UPI0037E99B80